MSLSILPIVLLVLGILSVLIVDLISRQGKFSYTLALSSVMAAVVSQLLALVSPDKSSWVYIDQVLAFDWLGQTFSLLALFLAFLAVGISKDSFVEEQSHSAEFYALALTATLGAVLVAQSKELLTFFLAFELLSIPLYVLAGFRRYHRKSAEAGVKYFLSGALSTAVFLFGASWVYGAGGTTLFTEIPKGFSEGHQQPLILGLLMIIGAFVFKISAAPFHMWAPDTYEGAPIPVAAFLSTVPKVAMIGVIIRLILPFSNQLSVELMLIFAALAALSIIMGNVVAITQSELTRMMAYSGVAQIGYILIGISAIIGIEGAGKPHLTQQFLGSVLFYLVIYTVTNLAFWLVLLSVGRARRSTRLDALNGLSQTDPFLALCLMVAAFSLAGVPPLAGFIGKLYLFRAAFYTQPLLAVIGMFGSVVSLYYYFNVLRRCYFLQPDEEATPIACDIPTKFLLGSLLLLTLVGGLWPDIANVCFFLSERMLFN